MSSDNQNASKNQVPQYFFPTEEIPRLSCTDPEVNTLIESEKPVVITDVHLCDSALKWNLDYLKDNMGQDKLVVFSSKDAKFKYYDSAKIEQYKSPFTPPTTKSLLTFSEFSRKLHDWKPGDEKMYLQQRLNSTVGQGIVKDFLAFNWKWLEIQRKKNKWGPLTSNLLLVGMEGNITPVHYDEQQNFFVQLVGKKRCLLFSPDNYDKLYPHTVPHPHDRQSQVSFDEPDFSRFPNLRHLRGYEAIVGPSDVLYIPMYWWHQIESLPTGGHTVSINFWYKGGPTDKVEYPLLPTQKIAIMRNVEKMLIEVLQDSNEVGSLLRTLVLGRYTSGDIVNTSNKDNS